MPDRLTIDKSIAVVGVSKRNSSFGNTAYRTLKRNKYRVYAVSSSRAEFEGDQCYESLLDLPDRPDCVLVSVKPDRATEVVEQAGQIGAGMLWFQQGADFSEAIEKASAKGLPWVDGKCILMYTEPVRGIHRFHRFVVNLFSHPQDSGL